MREKLLKIFDEILENELFYYSYQEETLIPTEKEVIKTLVVSYKIKNNEVMRNDTNDEKKITDKQLNLLKKILDRGNNKYILKEKFNINPEDIENISLKMAKEVLDFFLEDKNGKK